MRIKEQQLLQHLKGTLASTYFVFGAEIFLVEQSVSKIRAEAMRQGFCERIYFEVVQGFDWNALFAEVSSSSLFAPKRVFECHLSRLGNTKMLETLLAMLEGALDTLLIVSASKLTLAQQKAFWVKEIEQHGVLLQHWEVGRGQIVPWVMRQMQVNGLSQNQAVAEQVAYYTEGNLLAADQELKKLALSFPSGEVDVEAYQQSATEQSQYSVFSAVEAAFLGDVELLAKSLPILLADVHTPVKLLHVLFQELNQLLGMSLEMGGGLSAQAVVDGQKVWARKKPVMIAALRRHSYQEWQKLLLHLGRIDRSIKGTDNLIVEDEFKHLLLVIAGEVSVSSLL